MTAKRIGLMFAGQGAQAVGMAADIARQEPAAEQLFDVADKTLDMNISEVCFKGPLETLTESRYCQPAIYTTSLACLAALQVHCPIEPVVCGGLSLGEFAALQAGGVFAFDDGLELGAARGRLMQEACRGTDGAMAAVLNADSALVEKVCADHDIDVANLNCPGQLVISGPRGGISEAVNSLKEAGVSRVIMLEVDGAFHSRLMAPAAESFRPVLDAVPMHPPRCAVVQNYAGTTVYQPADIKDNLARQITGSVRWEDCVHAMLEQNPDLLIELGPGKVLSGFMRRIDKKFPICNVSSMDDLQTACEAIQS
ncbi:MAG: ACP S-malonyltransferase [Candidatus Pacebacteria bacterium]|nr:ACP S-malonyltransferase [Candidatus Paceibacterota bacterium]